jgi:hypothetical protein
MDSEPIKSRRRPGGSRGRVRRGKQPVKLGWRITHYSYGLWPGRDLHADGPAITRAVGGTIRSD